MSIDNIYGTNGIIPQVAVQATDTSGLVGTTYDANTLTYNTAGRYQISETVAPHNIVFHGKHGKEVGRFDFSDGDFKFDGDASEAAKVFIEWARRNWNDLRDKDRVEVLQQVIDDMLHEASGELYSEDEKVAILTCMQIVQKRKKEHEGGQVAEQYSVNLAKSMTLTKEAVAQSVLSAIAPEGKSL